MNDVLQRLKRERVWTAVFVVLAAAFIAFVQAIAASGPEPRPAGSPAAAGASHPAG
jgi:hypothetical protein